MRSFFSVFGKLPPDVSCSFLSVTQSRHAAEILFEPATNKQKKEVITSRTRRSRQQIAALERSTANHDVVLVCFFLANYGRNSLTNCTLETFNF